MRKQYHFQPSEKGFYAWDVDRLVELSKDLPIIEIDISGIKELDEAFWYGDKNDIPTCRSIVSHVRLINDSSLDYPIILSAENFVMDGMHRVCKALLNNISKIKAVKFKTTPSPDYKDVRPDDLQY